MPTTPPSTPTPHSFEAVGNKLTSSLTAEQIEAALIAVATGNISGGDGGETPLPILTGGPIAIYAELKDNDSGGEAFMKILEFTDAPEKFFLSIDLVSYPYYDQAAIIVQDRSYTHKCSMYVANDASFNGALNEGGCTKRSSVVDKDGVIRTEMNKLLKFSWKREANGKVGLYAASYDGTFEFLLMGHATITPQPLGLMYTMSSSLPG